MESQLQTFALFQRSPSEQNINIGTVTIWLRICCERRNSHYEESFFGVFMRFSACIPVACKTVSASRHSDDVFERYPCVDSIFLVNDYSGFAWC